MARPFVIMDTEQMPVGRSGLLPNASYQIKIITIFDLAGLTVSAVFILAHDTFLVPTTYVKGHKIEYHNPISYVCHDRQL